MHYYLKSPTLQISKNMLTISHTYRYQVKTQAEHISERWKWVKQAATESEGWNGDKTKDGVPGPITQCH